MNSKSMKLKLTLTFVFFLSFSKGALCWTFNETTKLKGGYLICASKDFYDKARGMVDSNDREAFVRFASTGVCSSTKEGVEVYVINTHAFHGTYEVRPKGESRVLWVDNGAIRDSFTVSSKQKEDNQQAQATVQGRRNVSKLEGMMTDKGQTIIFISQDGKSSTLKVGDHVCEGEIIRTYSPGGLDGITSDQSVDKYEYRIKVRFQDHEEVFKNGDIICSEKD